MAKLIQGGCAPRSKTEFRLMLPALNECFKRSAVFELLHAIRRTDRYGEISGFNFCKFLLTIIQLFTTKTFVTKLLHGLLHEKLLVPQLGKKLSTY